MMKTMLGRADCEALATVTKQAGNVRKIMTNRRTWLMPDRVVVHPNSGNHISMLSGGILPYEDQDTTRNQVPTMDCFWTSTISCAPWLFAVTPAFLPVTGPVLRRLR